MKPLRTGHRGQGASAPSLRPAELGEVGALDRAELDFTDGPSLCRCLKLVSPALIVNAITHTVVADGADSNRAATFAIKAEAPHIMAERAANVGATPTHYWTDYVLDGEGIAARTKADAVGPTNVYGESKLAGDNAVAGFCALAPILRGRLRLWAEQVSLSFSSQQTGAPTTLAAAGFTGKGGIDRDTAGRDAVADVAADGATNPRGLAEMIYAVAFNGIMDELQGRGW